MEKRGSVLIVDNNETLLNMLTEGLSSEGYRCETTTSALTALELIGESRFDVMVTDIVMPALDGFELTEKAKKLRPDMAVIIMTGFIDDFSYDRALEAGASDFIKKPFTVNEMKMRLQHVTLRERLLESSMTDELTGLFNRRGFVTLAEQQLKLASRYRKGIFLLYAVLDNADAIDNAFGRREGEQALIDTAALLRKTYREADIIARTAGNKFVVLPVGYSGDRVEAITGSFRETLGQHNAEEAERGYKLSLTFGATYYDPEHPCSLEELLLGRPARTEDEAKGSRKP